MGGQTEREENQQYLDLAQILTIIKPLTIIIIIIIIVRFSFVRSFVHFLTH